MIATFLQPVYDAILGVKLEIGVFLLAAGFHFLLFSDRSPHKVKQTAVQHTKESGLGFAARGAESTKPSALLLKSLKTMLRAGAKQSALVAEIQSVISSQEVSDVDALLASVLDGLGRLSANNELLAAVRTVQDHASPSMKVAESLLRSYMALRDRGQFDALLAEAEAACDAAGKKLPLAISVMALQSCLGGNNIEAALQRLPNVAAAGWAESFKFRDHPIMQQLLRLASERGSVPLLLETLVVCGLCTAAVFEPIFLEAAASQNCDLLQKVEKLANEHNLVLTPAARCASLFGMSLRGCSDEDFLQHYDTELADVDVLTVHTKAARAVAEAALRLTRKDVLSRLLKDCEEPRKVGLLKSFGADGRLADARQLFEACSVKTSCLHNALLDATVGSGNAAELKTAIGEAMKAGVADVVTFNTVIKGYLQSGDLKSAKSVLTTMRSEGLAPNNVTFNELLDATVNSGSHNDAWALISEMRSCGLKPNKVTCSIMLKSISPSSNASTVERTMGLLSDMDDPMDEVLLSSVCEACIRTNRSDLLTQQLRRQRGSKAVQIHGAHTYGSLIRAHGWVNDLESVWAVWREMRMQNVLPTSITMGCMVEALVMNNEIEAGYQLIQEIAADERTKSLVNAVTYGSVLKGFCRQRCFSRVWQVQEEMVAAGLEFSLVTYNSLIDAAARSTEMQRVKPLLEEMSKHGITPNVITYSTVIKGYCAANRLDEAFELMEDMKKDKQVRPDEVTYNTLLDGCARFGLYDRGLSVLEDMKAARVNPSNFTLSVLVKLAMRAKRHMKAFELCDQVAEEFNLRLNVHVFDNLIQTCTTTNNMRKAFDTFERMLSEKVRPDQRSYTLMLRGCMSSCLAEESLQLVRSASGLQGGHPRLAAYGSLTVLRGSGSAALLPSDVLTDVLDFACSSGLEGPVVSLVKELSHQPGAKSYQSLCQRYM
eukprot:TRINITY_DN2347_c0_g1_i1.p1 TRINITY_DN2347_c0_g1~~TRINITY_DN2347_c0_g1_i1.p1  ORF type:complete len:942 (-),score=261.05 TRINITY_DN2347_c0_g1_i1:103-2928(-)